LTVPDKGDEISSLKTRYFLPVKCPIILESSNKVLTIGGELHIVLFENVLQLV
jgi:hypothetical protein